MNITESTLIAILKAFALDTKPKLNMDSVDTRELFTLAKRHGVIGIVAYVANKYGLFKDKEEEQRYMHEYDRTVMQMVSRETSAARVFDKLTELSIPHIVFKGMKVSETYPVAELRTYGDVDIIIRKQDVKPLCEYMISQGYSHSVADAGVVNVFRKNREHYEFHTNLNVSNIKDSDYFSALWDNCVVVDGESRQFTHNFHLSYLITHLEKHVYGRGAGLRMYLDIALYIRSHAEEIDLDFVRETLTSCGLDAFLNTVLHVCHKWFGLSVPEWVTPLSEDVYGKMCDFTLNGGVFGIICEDKKIEDSIRRGMESGKKGLRFKLLMHRIFPPFHELCRLYPKYSEKPLLAPVAWVNHIYRVFKDKKYGRIKAIACANIESASDQKAFLESIGSSR